MHNAAYFLAVAAFITLAPQAAHAENKVGVVDVRRAMEATAHWKDAYGKLDKVRTERQLLIEGKKQELKTKKEALAAKKAVSDPKSIAKEEEALYREAGMFMRQFQMSQQELTYLEKQLADQMLTRLEAVVRKLSAERGYEFVFEAGLEGEPNVLWSQKKVDITADVAKAYKILFKDKPLEMPKLPQRQQR
jgi:outer membrane protein